jgi:trafficking protein particle complex subunit 10
VLEQTIDEAVDELPQYGRERNRLITHMIRALESDADWVELYGITGELRVPAFDGDSATEEILFRIRQVGHPITVRKDGFLSFRRCWPRAGPQT